MLTDIATFRLGGLALLFAASSPAVANYPTITATGTFDAAPYMQVATPSFINLHTLNGKPYVLELSFLDMPAYEGAEAIPGLPGGMIHSWTPGHINYMFAVGGNVLFSGVSFYTDAEAINDVTPTAAFLASLPPDAFLPPMIQAGGTYDDVIIDVAGIPLGCVNGGVNGICDQPGEVFENVSLSFEYAWDIASMNAIASLPGNSYAIPTNFFSGGQGMVGLYVSHYDQNGTTTDIAIHGGLVSGVTLAMPVPEAETWALMLAGLGLVGWQAMRRRMV